MTPWIALMRLDKPIGILLLLWPTLWALWLASKGHPDPFLVGVFVTGVVLMRSAGCVMNDMADARLDAQVTRTRSRPLATGTLTRTQAGLLLLGLLTSAASLLLFLNPLSRWLAVAGVLLCALYPFMKRITHLPQLILGVAFSLGIPMAFAASLNALPVEAFWPFAAAFCWTVMYDTLYAMTDRPDDIKAGIRSTAILFGRQDRVITGLLQLLTLALLFKTGKVFYLGRPYYASVVLTGLLFLYQQWLIRHRDPATCFRAFLNNQWAGLLIFMGIVLC